MAIKTVGDIFQDYDYGNYLFDDQKIRDKFAKRFEERPWPHKGNFSIKRIMNLEIFVS